MSQPQTTHPEARTFRGRSLADVLPQVREELGEGAIALNVRQGTTGGIAGFFAQRCVEVDAIPGPAVDQVSGDDEEFERMLAAATRAGAQAPDGEPFVPADVPGSWDQLIEEARSAAQATDGHASPTEATNGNGNGNGNASAPAAPAEPAPAARSEGASALAAMFQPDRVDGAPASEPAAAPAPSVEMTRRAATPAPEVSIPSPAVPVEPSWPQAALDVHRGLTARGMDPDLVTEIVAEAVEHMLPFSSEGSLRPLVAGQLARCLPPMPRRRVRGGRSLVIGFVGAGGSGKTRCSARLALAYARRGDRPVALLTLRPKDRGAELMADVSHAGIPVHAAEDAHAARRFLDHVGDRALVVVDTPGVSPRAEAELRQLAAELRQLQLDECHLTLPATLSPQAAAELVRGTRSLGVDALAITHVDETEHLGAAIGAAIDAQLPVSYVGRGASADRGGLRPALVEALALELVG
jgi:flagellar biosynthesis GTPase FlhF